MLQEERDLVKLDWETWTGCRDVEFEGVGGGELRWVSLAGFMELGKAGMNRVGVVCRIKVLGPKVFPVEAADKGDISNQAEMIKAGLQGKGETFREDRGFGSSERLGGEVNHGIGLIDRHGVYVGRGG